MDSRIGQRLGNYRLASLLGSGGFGEVYLGEHIYLNRLVAIKVLPTQVSRRDEQAFLREGQIIASLEHPNILRILDFGTGLHLSYLVMEYAPGGTLRQRHPRGSLVSITTILPYVQQMAAALQYAHDRRLIHRDIKPENMLIGSDGHILLGDFGISTILSNTTAKTGLSIIGTIGYMAPEQFDGRIGRASDQYALGVVVYEWLCGRRPFHGSTMIDIAMQHLTVQPPSLREIIPDLPGAIEEVVMQALAKNPRERFTAIQEFALALQRAATPEMADLPGQDDPTDKKIQLSPEILSQHVADDPTDKKSLTPQPVALPGEKSASEKETSAGPEQDTPQSSKAHTHARQVPASEKSFPPVQEPFAPGFTPVARDEARESLLLPPAQTQAFAEPLSLTKTRKHFFISYSRADRERAIWIATCLQEAGYSVLLPPVDFRMGFIFRNEMQKAFALAERMLVAFSPNYLTALKSRSAGLSVFKRAVTQKQGRVLSVCVRDHDSLLEELSGVANYIDLTGENESMARAVLLAYICGKGIELPAPAPLHQAMFFSLSETPLTYANIFGNAPEAVAPPMTSTLQAPTAEPAGEQAQVLVCAPGGIEVFFSYSHKDEEMRQELETHLSNLKRQRVITGWHDGEIRAGDLWEEEIDMHLSSAHIILLLVSPDFIDSNYCYEKEMLRAMERHKAGEAHVVPIILRPAHWERTPFGKLQALPSGAKALTLWTNRDEAFVSVARGLQKLVDSLSGSSHASLPDPAHQGAAEAAGPALSEIATRPLMSLPSRAQPGNHTSTHAHGEPGTGTL
ncbi:MAG TPA: protein kinase [Ktedonobacteraceae bacterium]|jgi:serine/threonine protein kinase